MSDETTLLPCPWCGVDMKLHAINYPWADGDPGWNIWHEDMGEAGRRKCPMEMGCYDTREEAIAAWNTRSDYAVQAENERKAELESLVRDLFDREKYFNPERYGINVLAKRARELGIEVNL